jgi:hypothetical protein
MTIGRIPTAVLLFCVLASGRSSGEEKQRIAGVVTYLSGSNIYVDAGREKGLEVGDTLTILRKAISIGRGVIIAVSSNSSASQLLPPADSVAVGDSARVFKIVPLQPVQPAAAKLAPAGRETGSATGSDGMIVHGRVGLQYAGAGSLNSRPDFSQPSVLLRLDLSRMPGGLSFSFYGRSSYDLADRSVFSSQSGRWGMRLFEMALAYDNPGAWYGFGVGRLTSRYVGGLGAFDGGQIFVRQGNLSAGFVLGFQPDYRTSQIQTDQQKMAGFVNYAWGGDVFHSNNSTIAYGQQLFKGKLDRDFLYLQNTFNLGSALFLYQSSEVDLHDMKDSVRSPAFRLNNTFVTLSYMPVSWLTANAGYDATRNYLLFESMKTFPDTLIDRELQQGFRVGASIRLPLRMSISGTANFRLQSESGRQARTFGTSFRMGDIGGSEVNVGAQYLRIQGLYTDGDDMSVDIDRWVTQAIYLSLRLDRYAYTYVQQPGSAITTTAGLNVNVSFTRSWYFMVTFDRVWDPSRNSFRAFGEISYHF